MLEGEFIQQIITIFNLEYMKEAAFYENDRNILSLRISYHFGNHEQLWKNSQLSKLWNLINS